MKKKLLLSLLTILLAVTTFTSNVFAETANMLDLLDTTEGGFPTATDDATAPDDSWYDSKGYLLALSNDRTKVIIYTGGTSNTPIPVSMDLTKDADGNYTISFPYTQSRQVDMKFIMNNNKLVKIEVRNYFTFDFEPLGNRTTLKALFDTLTNKPTSEATSWVNENDHHIYINGNFIYNKEFDSFIYMLYTPVSKSGNNYTASLPLADHYDSTVTAYMQDNKLTSLKVDISDSVISENPTQAEFLQKVRGTYSAPITVGDILSTFNNFPTTSDSGWVNANGKRIYINNNMINVSYNVPLDTALQKDGNNYKYAITGQSCTFVMTSGVLSSIIVTAIFPDFNGEYTPYRLTTTPGNISPGYTGDIEFITNGKYVDQTSTEVTVTVDSTPLDYGTDFEVTPGSTHIKILGSFLSGLSAGEHPITIAMTGYSTINSKIIVSSSSGGGGSGSSGHAIPNTGVK